LPTLTARSCRRSAPTSPGRISREEFAQRVKLGKSTVDKLVVGIFSEDHLQIDRS
jgi:hypothetical protein